MNTVKAEVVLVQLNGQVVGPFPVKRLYELKGFNAQTLVSYPGTGKWASAWRVLNLKTYAPPVANSEASDTFGNSPNFSKFGPAPLQIQFMLTPTSTVSPKEEAWVDRWFRRLAVFNGILAIGAVSAWFYFPLRAPASIRHPAFVKMTPRAVSKPVVRRSLPVRVPAKAVPFKKHR